MSDPRAERVYTLAMSFGTALTQHSGAIDELIAAAEEDVDVLEQVRRRIDKEIENAAREPTTGVNDMGPPEAPALVASRLLRDAVEDLEARA